MDFSQNRPLRRALATNSSASGFATISPQAAKPSGDGVIDLCNGGNLVPRAIKLWGIGVGSADDAYSMRLVGWHKAITFGNSDSTRDLWIPVILAELGIILGSKTGVAGTVVPATELFADTVTIISGGEATITANTTRDGTIWTYSPTNNLIGFAVVPLVGVEMLQFDFDQTTNTPTMNALYAMLN